MTTVGSIPAYSPLTQNDMTRLPQGAQQSSTAPMPSDSTEFSTGEKKMSPILKAIVGLGIAAAAIVTTRRTWLKDIAKYDDIAKETGFVNGIKKALVKTSDYIEWPYHKIVGLFKKADKTPTSDAQ